MTDLYDLRDELIRVESMSEEEVCAAYNADSKYEILNLIKEDISFAEAEEFSENCSDRELEEEKTNLCISQGISRFC